MADYREPLGGVGVRELPDRMRTTMTSLEELFPGMGLVLLVATPGQGGACAHITNIDRDHVVPLVREYADLIERRRREGKS